MAHSESSLHVNEGSDESLRVSYPTRVTGHENHSHTSGVLPLVGVWALTSTIVSPTLTPVTMSPTTLPDSETLAKAYKVQVLDSSGKSTSFGSLVQDQETIVVFIR